MVFGNALFFDFVWDDNGFIVGQSNYQQFDLRKIFFSPANGVEYLPVRDLTYVIDYYLWGWNPLGFHLSNIVFYSLNLVFIYLMTLKISLSLFPVKGSEKMLSGYFIALFTTVLFAVSPLHSEPVSFIICRNVLVSGLFFFMSCYFYLTFISDKRYLSYAAALLSFLLALFSKATAIILPAILLIFLFHGRKFRLKNIVSVIPFFALSGAGYLLFKFVAKESAIISEENVIVFGSFNFLSKIAIALQIPFFYLKKLILPTGLSAEYMVHLSRELWSVQTILAAGTLSVIIFSGFALKRKYPQVLFAILWFLICLVPVLNFFLTTPLVADRYVFLSSYSFAYLFAVFIYGYSRGKSWLPAFAPLLLVLILHSYASFSRNEVWRSNETVMLDMIRSSPENPKGYSNLGQDYFDAKNYKRAFELFAKLKEIDASDTSLEYYRALLDFSEGRSDDAIQKLKYCVSLAPHNTKAWNLLGQIYESKGQIYPAIDSYKKALKTPEAFKENLKKQAETRLIALRQKLENRFSSLRKQIQANPDDFTRKMQYATELQRAGLNDMALKVYKNLLGSNHFNWQVHYNMGLIYGEMELNDKAVKHFKKCLSSNGNFVRALNDLGLAYKKLNKYDLAAVSFKKAIDIDRKYSHATFNLARLYYQLGDKENALKYFTSLRRNFPKLIPMTDRYYSDLKGYGNVN